PADRKGLILGWLVAAIFVAAEGPALVPITDRVVGQSGLGSKCGIAKIFRAKLWPVAATVGRGIGPPTPFIFRDAVEYLVADVWVFETDAHQLREVLGPHPDGQPAPVDRSVGDIADAQAGDAQAMLVGIKRRDRLAERLADAVARI